MCKKHTDGYSDTLRMGVILGEAALVRVFSVGGSRSRGGQAAAEKLCVRVQRTMRESCR